jgi:hypothetical protein
VRSGGVLLCDDFSILRVRLANADERRCYREKMVARSMGNPLTVYLVDVDGE